MKIRSISHSKAFQQNGSHYRLPVLLFQQASRNRSPIRYHRRVHRKPGQAGCLHPADFKPDRTEEVLKIPYTLTVAAYTEFRGRLEPSLADEEKTVQVILDNLGNHPETFTLSWESLGDRLQFFSLEADAPPAGQSTTNPQQPTTSTQLHLANGQSVAYEFFTRARTHPWFGENPVLHIQLAY